MPLYKQVLLTNLKSTPKDVAKVFQDCAQIITQAGGVIRSTENRGEKRLGYGVEDRRWGELQRHYEGKLIVSQFNASPAILKDVELKLKNSFPIIRFQTFKVRDSIDSLMNMRKSLEQIQQTLKPKAAVVKADDEDEQEERAVPEITPERLFDHRDEEESAQFKKYIPDWKRDALYTPSPPDHVKN